MKQVLQMNIDCPAPGALTQLPFHPSWCPQKQSGALWLHSDIDLPRGRGQDSWPPGISPRAQVLDYNSFHHDTRYTTIQERQSKHKYSHIRTQNQEDEVKILPLHASAYSGQIEKSKYAMSCFCKKDKEWMIKEDQCTNLGKTQQRLMAKVVAAGTEGLS